MMKIVELGTKYDFYGKAGNLNKLYNFFNIARGFILSNEIFMDFLKYNNISLDDDYDSIRCNILNGVFLMN